MIVLPATSSAASWIDRISPQINAMWCGAWKPGTVEPSRYLTDHELVLVTKGSCEIQIGETRHQLIAGQFIVIPPDTRHATTTSHGVFRYCIHFDWIATARRLRQQIWYYFPERPDRLFVSSPPSFIPAGDLRGSFSMQKSLPSRLETLFHRWQTCTQAGQSLARASLVEILVLLFSPPHTRARSSQPGIELACRVRDLLDQHSGLAQSIQGLLTTLGFSYPHLCRLFRSAFGVTPVEYRNALRLERAKGLLSNSKLTIAEIAYESGFTDAGYFTRQFRRQNGLSPRELRRQATDL